MFRNTVKTFNWREGNKAVKGIDVISMRADDGLSENLLTLTRLWADSTDEKLIIFFLEIRIWYFMQIVS